MFPYRYPAAWSFHRATVHSTWSPDAQAKKQGFAKPDCGYAQPGASKSYSAASTAKLPSPEPVTMGLGAMIQERASCRRFARQPLTMVQLSTILAAAYGISPPAQSKDPGPRDRPVPSAGGCYPLELYPLLWNVEGIHAGIYHYQPLQHSLEFLQDEPPRSTIASLFLNQPYLVEIGALIILTAVVERQLSRYGDRGYRYFLIEAGHVVQNVGLVAAAVDVGCLALGGFLDDSVAALLDLEQNRELALYGVALGSRASKDRVEGRGLEALR